jgi:hypothetical protein
LAARSIICQSSRPECSSNASARPLGDRNRWYVAAQINVLIERRQTQRNTP